MTLVYVHVLNHPEFTINANHFLRSYREHPPLYPHDTMIVFNNGQPTPADRAIFQSLPDVSFYCHDNSGQDIGAFIAVSKHLRSDFAVYFGATSYVQRAGWLARMVEAYEKRGFGIYGSIATFEVSPHLATSGFWCDPILCASYPIKVETKAQRYDFEHGPNALWKMVAACGLPAMLVTWLGEYHWPDWRKPQNIYRRGTQSACIAFYRHSTNYGLADPNTKRIMEGHADVLMDRSFF